MKKGIIIAVAITIIILILSALTIFSQKETISYSLQGKEYELLVADNSQKWQKGLMDKKRLDNADGMIFIFPDKSVRSFWNENTYLDLDLYWLDDDKVIGKSFLPSVKKQGVITVTSPAAVNKVIELVRK